MKTEEDEAFDELAKRQGSWGGGFQAKRRMAEDKLQEPWNEDEWRRNNWRCQHGWLRGEQCEICNASLAPKPAQDGKCKYCVDGCAACDARAQPNSRRRTMDEDDDDIQVYKRPWVGLTEEETQAYWDWEDWQTGAGRSTIFEMVRDIEQLLKERNT